MRAKKDSEIFLRNLVDKYSLGTLPGLEEITLEYFLWGATRYVLISLRKIIKPKQYEDLAKKIEAKNLTYIVPIKCLELGFNDYLGERDYLVEKYSINLDLMPKDYLSFVDTVVDFLPKEKTEIGLNLRVFYLRMLLWSLSDLLNKLPNNDISSIWMNTYQMGLLQGLSGIWESTVDPELIDKHHREKSGEGPQRQWNRDRKAKERKEKPLKDKIKKLYKDIVRKAKEPILHNEIADYIHGQLVKEFPQEAYNLKDLILNTIRPMARKDNLLRGAPRPDFPGTVVKVDMEKRHIVVKNKQKKTFFVSKAGGRGIQLADLKGMNVSVTWRIERGRMVARVINVTGPVGLSQKKGDKKPARGPKE